MADLSIDAILERLRQAQRKFEQVETMIARIPFTNDSPRFTCEMDADMPGYRFHVWNLPPLRRDIGLVSGECIHHTRAALDNLAYSLAVLRHGQAIPDDIKESISFPITQTPQDWSGYKAMKSLRPGDRARIEMLQPYNAWDPSIWTWANPGWPQPALLPTGLTLLKQLDDTDKHRHVNAVWFTVDFFGTFGYALPQPDFSPLNRIGSSTTNAPLEDGAEVGTWHFDGVPPDPPPQMDVKGYFPLAVHLGEFIPPVPLLQKLAFCLASVNAVARMFEPCVRHNAPPAPLVDIGG